MIELAAGDLRAVLWPEHGLVASSLTHRGEELLGQRRGLERYVEANKTFGIPLLHPWANRLGEWSYDGVVLPRESPYVAPDEHGLPMHGLLHGRADWDVVEAGEDRLRARYDFGADRARLPLFPFPHVLEVDVTLDAGGIEYVSALRATGEVAVPIAFGWHPYVTLPGVAREAWELRTSVRRRLVLDDQAIPTGEVVDEPVPAGPLGDRSYDDGYTDAAGAWLVLAGGGRELELRFGVGYTHAQLFAPPGQPILAFEPMTAPADALRSGAGLRSASPGETFTAGWRLEIRD